MAKVHNSWLTDYVWVILKDDRTAGAVIRPPNTNPNCNPVTNTNPNGGPHDGTAARWLN